MNQFTTMTKSMKTKLRILKSATDGQIIPLACSEYISTLETALQDSEAARIEAENDLRKIELFIASK